MRAALVVLAGGSGTRVGAGINKVYLPLAGRPLIAWSFTWAAAVREIAQLVLVVRPGDETLARDALTGPGDGEAPSLGEVSVVAGGSTRHASEQAALDHLRPRIVAGEIDVVAIHDGARPLAGPGLLQSVVTTAAAVGGAVPVLAADGVLAVDGAGRPCAAEEQDSARGLARVQTPQAFRAPELLAVYAAAARAGYQGTDTAASVEAFSDVVVQAVTGSRHNLKVTYPHDLVLAERLLAAHQGRLP